MRRKLSREANLDYALAMHLLRPEERVFIVHWDGGWWPIAESELYHYTTASTENRSAAGLAVRYAFGALADNAPDVVHCNGEHFHVARKMSGFVLYPVSAAGKELPDVQDDDDT